MRLGTALSLLLCLTLNAYGNGMAEKPPVIQMQQQPRLFISPGNPDATVKNLTLPFSTIAITQKGQVIHSWTFSVYDSSGKLVSDDSRLETRDRGFWGELFNIGDRPQVEIPKELSWDGTYKLSDSPLTGTLVPDGNYTYQLTVSDSNGKQAQTPPFNVTVKNAALGIDYIRVPQTIFSPKGQRKSISIQQSTTREKRWVGVISDASERVIRTWVWENSTMEQLRDVSAPIFEWDGKADDGTIVPDGEYTYTLEGLNRAGATLARTFSGSIMVDSQSGVVKLSASSLLISPNGDSLMDSIDLLPNGGDAKGVVSWALQVTDASHPGIIRWFRTGKPPLPDKFTFDGRDPVGNPLPDGRYQAELSELLENGDRISSSPVIFEQSSKGPKVSMAAENTVFGGNGRAGVTLNIAAEPGPSWTLEILDKVGANVRTYDLGTTGAATVDFQGFDSEGKPFPDGPFTARVSGRNKFGNLGTALLQMRKDSRPMSIRLELSSPILVPGTSPRSSVRITPVLAVVDSITNTKLSVSGPDGIPVATRQADTIIPFWDWNGKAKDGIALPDGSYTVSAAVTYANGAVAKASTQLTADSMVGRDQGPQVGLRLSSKTFAPENIDGPQTLTIGIEATAGSDPLNTWSLTISDPRGKAFRVFHGNGAPPATVVWDGKSATGEFVESGEDYAILLKVADSKERVAQQQAEVTTDIVVSKLSDGRYKIVVSAIQYAGYSSDVFKVTPDLLSRNISVLQKLAEVFKKFANYTIHLQGYAVSEFWNDPQLAAVEQQQQLLPLSLDRAQEVRSALVLLGVNGDRFTVDGFGSENPVVPNSDLENRWKNRRVEFYLEKAQ